MLKNELWRTGIMIAAANSTDRSETDDRREESEDMEPGNTELESTESEKDGLQGESGEEESGEIQPEENSYPEDGNALPESGEGVPETIMPVGKTPEKDGEEHSEEEDSGENGSKENGTDAEKSEEPYVQVPDTTSKKEISSGEKEESSFSPLLILVLAVVGVFLFLSGVFVGRKTGRKKISEKKSAGLRREMPGPVEEIARTERIDSVSEPVGNIPGGAGTVGKLHNIGMRKSQQDSLGVTGYKDGILAVVADGMGGLSDGDKVSQKVVLTMLQDAVKLTGGSTEGALWQMVAHANREVNYMLGVSDHYKSGSTLLAVLVEKGKFQWISVGDSRIYLYRQGQLFQVNREHVYEMDLLRKAVNGIMTFAEVAGDPQKKHVASFIGMGELKYVDSSMRSAATCPGDKLLLMSDGVFNTISEQEIRTVLARGENAENTARLLEEEVLARRNPKQDNFTAVILDI